MSFRNLYATSRDVRIGTVQLGDTLLNGGYSTTFWNDGQFADFASANIVKISQPIPVESYTGKIPVIGEDELPTGEFVPKLTRFVTLRYSDKFTNYEDLKASIEKTGANTGVQVFATSEEARVWIRSNTNLVEESPGKFLVREAGTDMMGNATEAQYLTIE